MPVSSSGGADRWVLDAYRVHLGDLLCHISIHANVYRPSRDLQGKARSLANMNIYAAGDQDLCTCTMRHVNVQRTSSKGLG